MPSVSEMGVSTHLHSISNWTLEFEVKVGRRGAGLGTFFNRNKK